MKKIISFVFFFLPLSIMAQTSFILSSGGKEGEHKFGIVENGDTIWDDAAYRKMAIEKNRVYEFCNIPFGTSYEEVEEILKKKFGQPDREHTDRQGIYYSNVFYAGKLFDTIYFMFQSDGENSYMNGGKFILKAKGKRAALRTLEEFNDLMKERYPTVETKIGKYKGYIGGQDPLLDESKFGFYIDIIRNPNMPYGELSYEYFVRLCYGPFNYIEEGF